MSRCHFTAMSYFLHDREIPCDSGGFLLDHHDWSPELIPVIAQAMGLELTPAHLTIIRTVRTYFENYADTPPIRGLIALLRREGHPELADSITLAELFPDGAAKSAARLAGLKKPVKCI